MYVAIFKLDKMVSSYFTVDRFKIYQLFIIKQNLLLSNAYGSNFTISNYELSYTCSCAQVD